MVPAKLGGIYAVADDPDNPIIKFPTDNLPEGRRTFHPQRYVLVVQADSLSRMPDLESVLVVPNVLSGIASPGTLRDSPPVLPSWRQPLVQQAASAAYHRISATFCDAMKLRPFSFPCMVPFSSACALTA